MPHDRKAEKSDSTLMRKTKRSVEGSSRFDDELWDGVDVSAIVNERLDVEDIVLAAVTGVLAWTVSSGGRAKSSSCVGILYQD